MESKINRITDILRRDDGIICAMNEMQCRELKIDPEDHFTRLIKTTEFNTIGSITLKEIRDEIT